MQQLTLLPPAGFCRWLQLYLLYRTSFPRAERKPFRVIRRMYREKTSDIWCLERDGIFLGFASTMNSPDLIMLDYFAVSKRHRGQGIGTAALQKLKICYDGKGIFLEIESPREPGPDQIRREKRKQFYLRCGMEPLQVMADVFGVKMELLGWNCQMDFPRYHAFYRDNYTPWAAAHIHEIPYPGAEET